MYAFPGSLKKQIVWSHWGCLLMGKTRQPVAQLPRPERMGALLGSQLCLPPSPSTLTGLTVNEVKHTCMKMHNSWKVHLTKFSQMKHKCIQSLNQEIEHYQYLHPRRPLVSVEVITASSQITKDQFCLFFILNKWTDLFVCCVSGGFYSTLCLWDSSMF